ncbi:hypothetical protein ACFSC4_01070 [Deinococcus malanensis]
MNTSGSILEQRFQAIRLNVVLAVAMAFVVFSAITNLVDPPPI